ncbi:serine carboxypeptidase-like 17 [Quercus suber]|uniref:Serine carboxypeptidase-like 17 n=1 Tax=Quercus suber TaxID=58331 RepID=A0AAW0JAU5_QUESU
MLNSNGFLPRQYLQLLVLLLSAGIAMSGSVVKTLPGYSGDLPFTLETGYIGVGNTEDVQLFYYFVESQRSPAQDPVVLWLTGGPGCSTLLAFFYESGPLGFTYSDYNGSLPSLHLNPYTWTKGLNIIYVDAPVGTGFSYSNTSEGYPSGDWMVEHPQFKTNQLYIGGDSYSGITVPLGYVLGNPKTDTYLDTNSRISFAYHLGLIPNDLYENVKTSCNGDFVNVDSSNEQCEYALLIIKENYRHVLSGIWANDKTVQEALHIREGTKDQWKMCNSSLSYTQEFSSVIAYHQNFTQAELRALIYSGDHDMSIPHIGTREWIRSFNMTLMDAWRAWFVDAQVAGLGGGHIAAEYKQKECAAMLDRWFAYYPL